MEQIIQQFAAREAEFKRERDNYTYTQSFVVQTVDLSGQPDGEYRMTSDIIFTESGKRYEKVTNAPPSTLVRVSLSEQDLADLQNVQPFVLTTSELPKYDITYVGRQKIDEISTYVFEVKPKRIEKKAALLSGTDLGGRHGPGNRKNVRKSGAGHQQGRQRKFLSTI